MPTPSEGYWLNGRQLLSVTTILWPYNPDGSDGLIGWAIKLFLEDLKRKLPIVSMEQLDTKIHIRVRKQAAAIGTMAHAAIEWWAQGGTYVFAGDPEITGPAKMAYGAFLEWMENNKFKITHTEVRLISKQYGYGGTLDVAGLSGAGKRVLCDWKTSNYVKKTMVLQVAGYWNLWNENFPDDPIVGGCNLLRFDKNTGAFTQHWIPEPMLIKGLKPFLKLHEVYQDMKEIQI